MANIKRNSIIFSIIAATILLTSVQMAQAATKFYLPSSGYLYGTDGTGVTHVKIDTNSDNIVDTWTETYCITHDIYIYAGTSYYANIYPAPENEISKSIAFILAWWHQPGTYSGTTTPGYAPAAGFSTADAATVQRAIWYYTDGIVTTGDALTIVNDAYNKDVIRSNTDILTLSIVSQSTGSATLKAKLTDASLTPIPNVMVVFRLNYASLDTGLVAANEWNRPSGYDLKGVTDSNGEILFSVTFSEASVEPVVVLAYTKGLWPKVLDPVGGYQELVPVTFGSTLVIKEASASLFVIPELPLGTAMALVTCFAGFAVYKKRKTIVST